jgi:F-type H+-transporting ATPase subunit epsilon
MTPFNLKIVTPDGVKFEGQANELIVRTTSGDMGILAGHINCLAPIGMGCATIISQGEKRYGACIGGMVSVVDGNVTLLPTTFEWSDEIDSGRAKSSYDRAQNVIHDPKSSDTDLRLAEAKLKRSLVRQSVAQIK